MRFKGSFILLVVALALLAYYMAVERPRRQTEIDAQVLATVLTTLRPEDVDHVTITRPSAIDQNPDELLDFRLSGIHWNMVAPVEDLAEDSAIMRLLAAMAHASIERNLGEQDDLDPFGMNDPVIVTASGPDARSLTLRVGGYTVDRGFVYASVDTSRDILLLPTAIRRYATAAVEDFRNPRVATFDVSLVESFTVTSPSRTTRWSRADGGWHTVIAGDTIHGNPSDVEGILRRLRARRVSRFPDELEFVGRVTHRIDVHRRATHGPQRFAMTPANRGDGMIIRIHPGDRLVEVGPAVLEIFDITVDDVRDKRLLHFDRSRVARIELTTTDTLATIVRSSDGWTYLNPGLGAMDTPLVEAILGAAGALSFDRVVSEHVPVTGLGMEPTFRLAVLDDSGTIIDELLCHSARGDTTVIATSRTASLVAELKASKLRALLERFHRIR